MIATIGGIIGGAVLLVVLAGVVIFSKTEEHRW